MKHKTQNEIHQPNLICITMINAYWNDLGRRKMGSGKQTYTRSPIYEIIRQLCREYGFKKFYWQGVKWDIAFLDEFTQKPAKPRQTICDNP